MAPKSLKVYLVFTIYSKRHNLMGSFCETLFLQDSMTENKNACIRLALATNLKAQHAAYFIQNPKREEANKKRGIESELPVICKGRLVAVQQSRVSFLLSNCSHSLHRLLDNNRMCIKGAFQCSVFHNESFI